MPFIYGSTDQIQNSIFNVQLNQLQQQSRSNLRFWIQLGVGIGTTILSLLPGIGAATKIVADIAINVAVDTAFAAIEKDSASEIATNLALDFLPAAGKLSRYFGKFAKNKVLFFANRLKIHRFSKGVNMIVKNEKVVQTPLYKTFNEQYLSPLLKTQKKLKLAALQKQLKTAIAINQKIPKYLNQQIKFLRQISNGFRVMTNSGYAAQKIGQKIVEKFGIKKKINELIQIAGKKLQQQIGRLLPKKLKPKFQKILKNLKEFWKKNQSIILPLHHVKSNDIGGWILGVKIIQSPLVNYFHIEWNFNPKVKKQRLVSYYKPFRFVTQLLNAKSAGKFYLDNIAFGWSVKNLWKGNNFFEKYWKVFNFLPAINTYTYFVTQNYRFLKNLFEKKISIEQLINQWSINNWSNILKKMMAGAWLGIDVPFKHLSKKIYASASSGNVKYLSNYLGKNSLRKTIKSVQNWSFKKRSKTSW